MSTVIQPGGATASGEEQAQNQQGVETANTTENESLTKLISSNVEPMREDQVRNAVNFLSHPKVRGSPVIYRRSFLEKKGLTREEIDEAFRRVPDPPSGANADNSLSSQANQQKSPSSLQPPSSAMAPASALGPTAAVSSAISAQKYKFQLSHALLAIGVLAASGAGSAVIIKKTVLPWLKAWIRKVAKEDNAEMEVKSPNAVEEAAQAAKEAAAAAALIAKVSQDLLNTKNEEINHLKAFKNVIDVQLEEMQSMRNSIHRLQTVRESKSSEDHQMRGTSINGPTYIAPKSSNVYQTETRFPLAPTVNINDLSMEHKAGRESELSFGRPAPANMETTSAPYSKSYMDVMAMIQRGETPPNIKEINDMPPNPEQQLPNPRIAPKTKPWEHKYQDQQTFGSSFSGNEGYNEHRDNGHPSYTNGRTPATSEYPWQKTVKISELDGKQEETKAIPYGPSSGEWRGRGWVPPQPPSVAIPEAAVAIRQPKQSAQKQQPGKEVSAVEYHLSEDGAGGTSATLNDTSSSSSQVAEPPSISEMQEEPSSSIQV